jgi:hypothetical protein
LWLVFGVDSAAREMKLCAVVGHTEHDGAYFAEVFPEPTGFSIGIDIALRDEIQFIVRFSLSLLMAFDMLNGRWVLDLELFACDFYFVDNVPVWCERERGGGI